jgi:transposase
MSLNSDTVTSEQLGHLGLVAATIRELEIIEKIDARLDLNAHKGGLVTYGRRVAAMVLNGLGFMNSRLSMTSHFFQDKPVSQLLGDEVGAEHLNDDCLGRCLDKIAEYGVTKLYSELAFEIAREKGILGQRLHLDSTSFERHVGKGRPKPGAEKEVVAYQIRGSLSSCLEKIKLGKLTLGRFILATNQFDMAALDNPCVLKQYKEQSCVESGFKFMKSKRLINPILHGHNQFGYASHIG